MEIGRAPDRCARPARCGRAYHRDVLLTRSLAIGVLVVVATACHPAQPPAIGDTTSSSVCPTHFDLELIGSESRFDPGFSGVAHGVGPTTGSHLTVEVTECDAECRRCRFRGPVRGLPGEIVTQRCLNDVSKVCAADADCAGTTGPCRFTFPPIPVPTTAQVPTCSIVYFELVYRVDTSPIQGVMDLATGESDNEVMNIFVRSAIETCRT